MSGERRPSSWCLSAYAIRREDEWPKTRRHGASLDARRYVFHSTKDAGPRASFTAAVRAWRVAAYLGGYPILSKIA